MMIRLSLESRSALFFSILIWKNFTRMSLLTEDDAARSCESAVDMVLARIPESTTPARSAAAIPCVERRFEVCTITVSEADPSSTGMSPPLDMASPTIPIRTATAMEITTHTDATLRESFSLLSSSIAIKRSRMWGMPKYPSPQASVEQMVRNVYGSAWPVAGSYVCVRDRYPGRDLALSRTAATPPACVKPKIRIAARASVIIML